MKRLLLIVVSSVAASAALPTPAGAAETTRALAGDGRVLAVVAGTQGQFFDVPAEVEDRPVLVLATRGGGETGYELVPSTDDPAEDAAPLLLHDARTDRTTVLWESRSAERRQVRLVQRDADGAWSAVEVLTDLDGDERTVFRTVSTHAVRLTLPDERTARAERDLVHLVWWQDDRLHYSAVILAGGAFVALPEAADVSAAVDDGELSPTVPAAALRETVSVAGLASGGLQASFVDRATDRLVTVEIAVAHVETAFFVSSVVERLLGFLDPGAPLSEALRAEMLVGGLRAEMLVGGLQVGMDDALLDFLATTAEAFTAGFFDLDPNATAEAWAASLSALLGDLLASIYQTAGAAAGPIEIELGAGEAIRVEQVLARPSPATGEGPTRVYAAEGGVFAIVGWLEPASETVFWVESANDPEAPWSEPRSLVLGEDLDLDQADALLRRRVE